MKYVLISLLLFSFLFLDGCIQAPSGTRRSSSLNSSTSANAGKTGVASTVYPSFAADEFLYWFTTAKVIGTVTINKNSQDIVYLRGKLLHDFLNAKDTSGVENYRKQFCISGDFGTDTAYKQLRVRAVPIYVTTTTTAIERLLRVDISSVSDNTSTCPYTTYDSVSNLHTAPGPIAFSLPSLCTITATNNCNTKVISTALNLYEYSLKFGAPQLIKIQSGTLPLASVAMNIDFNSNSTDSSSTCTNSSCSAKGFDCCISGQCVKDASEKANASSDPLYGQAVSDYSKNPLSFINYPNIYYVCSNISHTPPGSTTTTTTTLTNAALDRVAKYLLDYTCTTDVLATNSYLNCRNLDSITKLPTSIDKSEAAYTAIKKKLAVACGCTAADSEMSVKCPDWGIIPVYPTGATKINANITDFTCNTPAPVAQVGPISNLNVSVSNRSAPHRFYSSDGTNIDDLTGIKTSKPTTLQEGDAFSYFDEFNKLGPNNGAFNINSILGSMTIDLTHTLPAKEITVELGKTYILSSTSGYFTPCSQCVKDSWFQTFTAYPTTKMGMGLQASGYTTSRDSYSGNATFGNYEDTQFGRACFVPVTMLGLSHQKNINLQTQRQNRLKTQAAFYINGYQRDWYGFNKGALIGSFDGVTWFSVGTGRRATATTTKLFLAINAPFLDLADKTDTIVNIIPDFSANKASDYDYDPDLPLTDAGQNTGATCQKFHQCNADADCITQLGWEYTCADVSQTKTKWPQFDSDGKELSNQEKSGSLFEILSSTINTTNPKRCVYRGAGAPCKRDYTTVSDVSKKSLTCAPNFYCAILSNNKFNEELVRSPNELDNILFGMDTNILGRPLSYVTASKSLTTEIITNINSNALLFKSTNGSVIDTSDMGICRPGRNLTSSVVLNHSNPDVSKRTDYISQIGSCDSAAIGSTRFLTCPAFDSSQNLLDSSSSGLTASGLSSSDIIKSQILQNACGGEAKNSNTFISAFKSIEGLSLVNLQNIGQPILAQDACFRRAGSVCHTDLDCSPNKMHEDSVGLMDIKYFGGTDGEQQYWRESLICSQGNSVPALGSANYFDYKLSENRCCREVGKDFTMITQGPKSIVPENAGTNENLITSRFTYSDPKAANRYSRYAISEKALTSALTIPAVLPKVEPAADQWKVINETGSKTCCGGGWIRKFADGTHDWKVKNRLSIDVSNFSCLNFHSPLADPTYSSFLTEFINQASYQRESAYFCKSPTRTAGTSGCLQIPYQPESGYNIFSPKIYDPKDEVVVDSDGSGLLSPNTRLSRIDTTISNDSTQSHFTNDAPYVPFPYIYANNLTRRTVSNKTFTPNYFVDPTFGYGVSIYLPSYVGWDLSANNSTFIKAVYIKYYFDNGIPKLQNITGSFGGNCTGALNAPGPIPVDPYLPQSSWCITSSAALTQGRPVLFARADNTSAGLTDWKYAALIIDFKPIEQIRFENDNKQIVTKPGNSLYYLSKLSRLELLGIPQIGYEPLYCNNNHEKLVPGIFKSSLDTRTKFENPLVNTNSYQSSINSIDLYESDANGEASGSTPETFGFGNFQKRFSFQDSVDHSAVFSAKDFSCCAPLGKDTSSGARCCSGYSVTDATTKKQTCQLPKGVDLNVYFNKFVSNEGVGSDQPGGGLTIVRDVGDSDDSKVDFNMFTGEPKMRTSTTDKLVALGQAFCESKTVSKGGAFGFFPGEPSTGSYSTGSGNLEDSFPLSIVDSVLDFQGSDPSLGKIKFDMGYRWNHHYYCQ